MRTQHKTTFASSFEEDCYNGLTSYPKYLLSKYIYDQKGDKLFQDIMDLPEYYLTNCEYDILQRHTSGIAAHLAGPNGFDLIELGAGDGKKTKVLLRHLAEKNVNFNYLPVDISENVLKELENSLKTELPEVSVNIQQGTYFQTLEKLANYSSRKKVIMMLGSNIGNLLHKDAINFLKNISAAMSEEDMLFMGFDQKKDPQIILDAYNDPTGVTAAFNKNHLVRINRELGGNFDTDSFMHWETYDPESGTARSFLVSMIEQTVNIDALGLEVHFDKWETIHTEISQKYDDQTVNWLAKEANLKPVEFFTDERSYYKNYIFMKI
ncbi:L-histidine N(alpha)-methyltransferase [Antarcticibacterium flavum]|uniref:L-histidine N(Alpha)-methyltransferase n=1 Tax=Antarcticibacterium flavum TaxID=2058175 RepID=A0A5B7X0U9_9FLAO|nr:MULTISPECIES: L-histidine N(alpha)-methyltransferase [Antarcticibacterium]MCM4160922.1 L-histidine N(alpha)-methyltransferase [Antarcticibacterium sp. W02-3]QCY68967.1 L-histidine N(alpha)-methyltransferase [Antarcticibacterium flavum]